MKSIFAIFCIISSAAVGANKLSEANNLFTPDVYKEIIKTESGNIVFSSLSAEVVLTLLYSGTKGDSAQELATTLHLSGSKKDIQNDTRKLLGSLQSKGDTIFELANAAFVQKNFALKKSFLKVAKDYFSAEAKNLDFAKSQEAADTINKFVEDHTNGLIKNLVDPNSLSAATILVLVNALRFKGNWSIPFSQSETTKDNFNTPGGVIQVDTLHQYRKHFRYYQSTHFKAKFLELPFKGNQASMVIVLPTKKNDLPTVEKNIVEISTSKIPFKSTYLNVALPKFKFEYKTDFKKILTQLGVSQIFDPSQADLSGIAGNKGDLVVNEVLQKAYIDLNEGGVEAAAATYISVSLTAVLSDEPEDFIADHPFIFLLKYQGTTIFAGRIVEPKY